MPGSSVLVTTHPFGASNSLPIDVLEAARLQYRLNPLGRKLTEQDLVDLVPGVRYLIAGTEPITERVLDAGSDLRLISRVGVGLDSVDLLAARDRGIAVAYTPEAPAPAVAELTIGLMLSLLRGVHVANAQMHRGEWQRVFGRRIPEVTIGIVGTGRIGGRVLRRLSAFGSPRVLVNDIVPDSQVAPNLKLEWVGKEALFRESDVVSIHVPLTPETQRMIGEAELRSMKPDACLINVARGGIVDEAALYRVMLDGHLAGAAIDVFETEPYIGPLADIDRCLLTSHMGSMSLDCRERMEIEATEEVVRMHRGEPLLNVVPDGEYEMASAAR
jgi:D-3-phosphoglycerate dehydrogenase